MSQVETISIPVSARKHVAFTSLARGAGFISAVALGLTVLNVPKERVISAAAVMVATELLAAGTHAFSDSKVNESMTKEGFGTTQEKLESAGQGLGIGFLAIGACVAFIKLTTKGKDDD